ncbi:uncharacterized protein LY89DRAFT_734466 [Mollisia scopiformis]|uniref:AA9 family lytic polysaccharide monooxygenase n=1 Tax=Mollisia scopiformis TaxID=149040 RepID=A0A194X8C4_MOLSC|nr:uncharacterized protein LY89DRAFT_734466 [Mollisia scopiformis]KUJ16364.1 hypothetical protein LY89DRAFT_734466 [Mollisia scopiformis]
MKLTLATGLAALQTVSAHTLFTTLFINDVNQGDGTCVRMPITPSNATFPIIGSPTSIEMACGNRGNASVPRTCPAPNGAKLTFTFRETPNLSSPGAIDASHKGPCAVYMKNVESPMVRPNGDSWFKIWDEGYDAVTSKWCTEKLIDSNGLLSVNLPGNLVGGYYFVRTELLALQQADKSPPDPQFYIGCAQIFLGPANGSTSLSPQTTVSIPGYLNATDPALLFNIYTPTWPYVMLGPVPYNSSEMLATTVPNVAHQMYGLLPSDAIITNANWWATELDSYSDVNGCWNASKSCFEQLTTCYGTAPPTGSAGCRIWEQRCDDVQSACNASIFTGLPNAGKSLMLPDNNPYPIPDAASQTPGQVYASQYMNAAFRNGSANNSKRDSSTFPALGTIFTTITSTRTTTLLRTVSALPPSIVSSVALSNSSMVISTAHDFETTSSTVMASFPISAPATLSSATSAIPSSTSSSGVLSNLITISGTLATISITMDFQSQIPPGSTTNIGAAQTTGLSSIVLTNISSSATSSSLIVPASLTQTPVVSTTNVATLPNQTSTAQDLPIAYSLAVLGGDSAMLSTSPSPLGPTPTAQVFGGAPSQLPRPRSSTVPLSNVSSPASTMPLLTITKSSSRAFGEIPASTVLPSSLLASATPTNTQNLVVPTSSLSMSNSPTSLPPATPSTTPSSLVLTSSLSLSQTLTPITIDTSSNTQTSLPPTSTLDLIVIPNPTSSPSTTSFYTQASVASSSSIFSLQIIPSSTSDGGAITITILPGQPVEALVSNRAAKPVEIASGVEDLRREEKKSRLLERNVRRKRRGGALWDEGWGVFEGGL